MTRSEIGHAGMALDAAANVLERLEGDTTPVRRKRVMSSTVIALTLENGDTLTYTKRADTTNRA